MLTTIGALLEEGDLPMPTYEYQCKTCGHHFERVQRFSDAPLTECPECSGVIRRVIHPAGIVFKGSGWYITDSRKGSESGGVNGGSKSETKGETKSETKSEGTESGAAASSSSESKPEPKAEKAATD
jgi:putative FmdB family regulatory protein